ncbi:MAG: hypothetical protein K2X53_04010, partial [Alphaproteobacteria bacterium]|nr:hypothetical protein [Alphaproteobacteria bacterium]
PEQELPYNVLSQIHPHVTRALNMGSVSLMEAKSYQKPVEWYLKTYQTYADALENAAAFYMVPHTAKTPRTLFTKDNYNSPEKYFSTFATIGHVIAGIFKARIHFLKTHAPEIDALLKVGFTPCKQGFSLPKAKLDENWHDLRPVDYYFKPQGGQLEEERPLFFALPKVLESKQALERKQLPNASWTDPIKQMIQAYHGLRKKDKATLENRINILNQISKTAEHLLQDASSAQTLSSLELEHLQELATVARNKSEYLSQLEVSLISEDRRRNLIPQDSLATTSIEIRRSNKLSEIYNDLDPEYRFHPYIYDYEELKEGKYIYPDLKLQKVTPFLEINEDEFIREEEDGSYHHKLSDQVDHLFDLKFSQLSRGKPVPPYFLWLENKNTLHTPRDLRRSVPQRDMLLEVNNAKAFNKIFVSPDHPVILDGVYLYTIPEDGKIYIFPGDRSDKLAMKEENAKLHEIARRTYGVDFEEFSTRTIHPLLCKGSNVFTAGEIKFKDGKIIHLNNFSGHYTPFDYHLLNGLKRLLPSYNPLFSPDATVRCLSKKTLPYQQFMGLDVSVLKDAFLREIGNS